MSFFHRSKSESGERISVFHQWWRLLSTVKYNWRNLTSTVEFRPVKSGICPVYNKFWMLKHHLHFSCCIQMHFNRIFRFTLVHVCRWIGLTTCCLHTQALYISYVILLYIYLLADVSKVASRMWFYSNILVPFEQTIRNLFQ